MQRNIFYIVLLLLIFLVKSQVTLAKEKILIYADDGYQPYSYIENGNPKGIYYIILKEAFSKLKDFE